MPETYTFLSVDDILTPAVAEAINSSDSQLTALQDEQMIKFIKWLNGELIRLAITKGQNGGLSYMKKSKPLKVYPKTTLNGIVLAGAASITLTSGTNWSSDGGRSVIETVRNSLDFVDHSAKASTHVLTVSTADGAEVVDIDHASGESIHRLLPLPSDFAKIRTLKVNSDPFSPCTFEGWFPDYGKYTTYGGYILLPRGTQNVDVTLLYEKKATAITARTGDGFTTNIPEEALRWAIEMTLFHLFRVRRKRGDLETTDVLAERYLNEFLQYDMQFEVGDDDLTFR